MEKFIEAVTDLKRRHDAGEVTDYEALCTLIGLAVGALCQAFPALMPYVQRFFALSRAFA